MQKDVETYAIEEKPKWGFGIESKKLLSTGTPHKPIHHPWLPCKFLSCWQSCAFKGQVWLLNTLLTEPHLKASTGFPHVRRNHLAYLWGTGPSLSQPPSPSGFSAPEPPWSSSLRSSPVPWGCSIRLFLSQEPMIFPLFWGKFNSYTAS